MLDVKVPPNSARRLSKPCNIFTYFVLAMFSVVLSQMMDYTALYTFQNMLNNLKNTIQKLQNLSRLLNPRLPHFGYKGALANSTRETPKSLLDE